MSGLPPRHALITGAGNGLGRQLAVRLAASGWHIGIVDLNAADGETTRTLVEEAGGTAEFLPLDVREERQWSALHYDLRRRWPQLDLLINNAGVSASGNVGQSSIEDWDWVLSINLRGVILGCHTMVDWLKSNPQPAYVLNIASAAALLCGPGMAAYNVSKAGVVALSQSMAIELKQHNVSVTVACPWFIRTNLLKSGRFATLSQRNYAEKAMAKARISPELFAKTVLEATFARKLMVIPGRRPRLAAAAKRLFPQTFMTLLERYIRRLPVEPATSPQVEPQPETTKAQGLHPLGNPVQTAATFDRDAPQNKETALI